MRNRTLFERFKWILPPPGHHDATTSPTSYVGVTAHSLRNEAGTLSRMYRVVHTQVIKDCNRATKLTGM